MVDGGGALRKTNGLSYSDQRHSVMFAPTLESTGMQIVRKTGNA
jgi:hypothetical protein